MNAKEHWESIYSTKSPDQVSWFQPRPTVSLDLIRRVARPETSIIDVGGGASTLVDTLIAAGFANLTVSDIASTALEVAQKRIGGAASSVRWRCEDILEAHLPASAFDVWHDRAVFHFLTSAADRLAYITQIGRALKPNGYVIVGTFAADGPEKCSGLDVRRYSATELHAEFGGCFELIDELREEHVTPAGTAQMFQYCLCAYRPAAVVAA